MLSSCCLDLISGMMEDANAKSQELTDAIRSLQRLLEESNKQYSDLEAELKDKESKLNQTLEAKNACIAALKQELKDANDLMKASKLSMLYYSIESLIPFTNDYCLKDSNIGFFSRLDGKGY